MDRRTIFIIALMLFVPSLPILAAPKTDDEIREIMIAESIAAYDGVCPCPYSINRAGRPCGTWSAYSKPGGAEPLCYKSDISDEMAAEYRRQHGL